MDNLNNNTSSTLSLLQPNETLLESTFQKRASDMRLDLSASRLEVLFHLLALQTVDQVSDILLTVHPAHEHGVA